MIRDRLVWCCKACQCMVTTTTAAPSCPQACCQHTQTRLWLHHPPGEPHSLHLLCRTCAFLLPGCSIHIHAANFVDVKNLPTVNLQSTSQALPFEHVLREVVHIAFNVAWAWWVGCEGLFRSLLLNCKCMQAAWPKQAEQR